MNTPRYRPLTREHLDVEQTLRHALTAAPEIELGWSILKANMRAAGWPARTPEGDRKPSTGPSVEPSALDYADPCGDQAMQLERDSDDLDAIQEHWHLVRTSLAAIAKLTRRRITPATPSVPACAVTTCEDTVERKVVHGRIVYLGMDQIAGHWVARPGERPTCASHRRRQGAA